ncbi:MAG TPA: O-antigen ligase family protein [Planctomycetota bacterium]|nr:O-antigen ligase family protein [Planctomycetota bacterium]
MIFLLFVLFSMNLILRFNDFIPQIQGFPVAEVCIPLLIGMWLLFEKKDFSLLPDLLIPAFFCVVVFGYAVMVWPGGAIDIARGMTPWVAMYFLTANLVRTRARLDWYLAALYVVTLALIHHSFQQWMSYDGIDDKTGVGWSGENVYRGRVRYIGVMHDPNDLALFFAMMLPVPLMLAGKMRSLSSQALGFALCLPLLAGIFFTNSRGGLLATGAVAGVYMWRRWGKLVALSVCLVLACAVLAFGPSRVRETDLSDQASTQGRIDAWYTGIQMLKQNPVLGLGKDQFVEYNYITAHNSFVLCFAETGLPGYILWFGAVFLAGYGMYTTVERTRPGSRGWRQSLALFTSLCAFCVGGFFLSRTYFILLPVFLGLAVAQFRIAREEWREAALFNGYVEESSSLKPDAPPPPDLTWKNSIVWMPRIACLAAMSIVGIYVLVKLKL